MKYPFYTRDVSDIAITPAEAAHRDHPSRYLPDQGVVDAVNVALVLNRPLLVTGEPGTGKTQLAFSVAWQLARRSLLGVGSPRVEKFETKSSSIARDLFYAFDTIGRFHAAQSGGNPDNLDYLTYNALGRAILCALPPERTRGLTREPFENGLPARTVVLIDEIDKAPRDFPNDLLNEIEQMYFRIPELRNARVGGPEELSDEQRPIVIITSNSERNLPDPFLRRCMYYDIPFPSETELHDILIARLTQIAPGKTRLLLHEATAFFLKLRTENVVRRRISPAELIQWISFMLYRGADPEKGLKEAKTIPLEGLSALTKDPNDKDRVRTELSEFLGT